MHTTLRATVLAATALVAASGTATAQNSIPGDTQPAVTVVTDQQGVTVTVADPGTSANASGTFANASGQTLTCAGATGSDNGGIVTEAKVVQLSMEYYRQFPYRGPMNLTMTLAGGLQSSGPITVDLSDLPKLLPGGSIAPMFGETFAARSTLSSMQTAATQAGHSGTVAVGGGTTFTVVDGQTVTWNAILGPPATGARTDFQAGAFFVCKDPAGVVRAYAGYEGGVAPTGAGTIPLGSAGAR